MTEPQRGFFPTAFRILRSLPAKVLLPALGIAAGFFVFALIADEVMEGDTQSFDEWVLRTLRTGEDFGTLVGPKWFSVYALDLTALGSYPLVTLILFLVGGILVLRRWYQEAWLLVVATIGGLLFNTLLKTVFDRPRPSVVIHLVQVQAQSFPSGHAMIAAVFYPTVGVILAELIKERQIKRYVLATSLVLALLVGSTRVLLGVHYPTDVLAGWVAGLTWALLCFAAMRFLRSRGWIKHSSAT